MNELDMEQCLELRREIFRVARQGGMAHLASCFSEVEILYTLYKKGVKKQEDRFVLSKGHGALALYTVLCSVGAMSREELYTYLQPGTKIGGEPYRDGVRIDATTGSLGHGLGMAVGMATAQKMSHKEGDCPRTFCLIGDGESQEGSIWEAAMSASTFGLDNLVVILDCNRLQKTNAVDETMAYVAWEEKWKAFGFEVRKVGGHDVDALQQTLEASPVKGKPTLVIADTIKGKGVSIMENNPIWHYRMPNRKETKVFLQELGLTEELE